jgi:hypothetical protein
VKSRAASYAQWELEQLRPELGSDLPSKWIAELSDIYLLELVFQLQSLATLIRAERIAATIEVIVRAAVERVARINWVLDVNKAVTPRIRAARAALETLRSLHYYREGFQRLGAKDADTKPMIQELRTSRAFVVDKFKVERPHIDPSDESSKLSEDVTTWVIEDQVFPDFTGFAPWAISGEGISVQVAKGTYDALSSFSHPNFVAAREHRFVDGDRITYRHDFDYTERLLRYALIGFVEALKHWITYFNVVQEDAVESLDEFQGRWEALTVEPTEPAT